MHLANDFEASLREAVLDDVEQTLREEYGPLFKRVARENFEAYAAANDYDIDHIWEDAEGPFVERSNGSVELRMEWPELTALFEFGVSPHTIEGNPVLHFYYEKIDQWVTVQSVEWGSDTGGIPESRAIRDAMSDLRQVMQS